MKLKALFLLLALPSFAHPMDSTLKWSKSFGVFATSWLTVLVTHEMGHAIAGKLFFNEPINIHFDHVPNVSVNENEALLNVGPFHFHGLPIFAAVPGIAQKPSATKKEEIIKTTKNMALAALGPLSGTICGLLLNKIINGSISNATSGSFIISMLNLLNLIPMATEAGLKSDGYFVWQGLKYIKYLLQARKTIFDVKK